MKTSTNKSELGELGAREQRLDVFSAARRDNEARFSQCLEINGLNHVLWLIEEVEDQFSENQKNDLRKLACDCALINIELIKPHCPENEYDLIVSYLNNPNDEVSDLAACVAWKAGVKAKAVKPASWAARAAMAAAARGAAVRETAAFKAAWAGARAAKVSKESEKQVTELLVNVFKKWEGEL